MPQEPDVVTGPPLSGVGQYNNVVDVFNEACHNYAQRPAFSNLGHEITFAELNKLSTDFASYLSNVLNLQPGTRIAIQMPNVLQYPVVLFGAFKAGLVVVNTNPLYTVREMVHQFNDSGAQVLIALANFGDRVAEAVPQTGVKTVILSELGDLLPTPKRHIVNFVVKYVKKMVPAFKMSGIIPLRKAMAKGRRHRFVAPNAPLPEDTAVLQYTGGTTGVAKGAELTHNNLVSNMLQIRGLLSGDMPQSAVLITPLPLYHIFSFMLNCLASIELGYHSVLITNPKDLDTFIKILSKTRFNAISAVNTLYVALMNHPQFKELDFSGLQISMAGGMALQKSVADRWETLTGCKVCEGFGMTETSPVATVNHPSAIKLGTVGRPVAGTSVKVIDAQGKTLPSGERGELCVKGPQVMKGYLNRPEATEEVIDSEGWLKTGDIAIIDEEGYVSIVDRIKDMILVSGFNVYPNEIEDEMVTHPDIVECAAIGIPHEKSGETVKLFVVRSNDSLTEEQVIEYARTRLTGYKVPKVIEFRADLPKSNVGKILRKELRPKKD
jgi:long-chain acyl-CoA synthetase